MHLLADIQGLVVDSPLELVQNLVLADNLLGLEDRHLVLRDSLLGPEDNPGQVDIHLGLVCSLEDYHCLVVVGTEVAC